MTEVTVIGLIPTSVISAETRARVSNELASLWSRLSSEHSRRAYAGDWRRFTVFLHKRGSDPLVAGAHDVAAFLGSMTSNGRPAARATRARAASALRELLAALYRAGVRADNPAREVKVPQGTREPQTPWMTEAQIVALLRPWGDTWVARRDRLVLLFVLGLAVRRTSAARARVDHLIRRPDGRLGIRVLGKGGKTADLLMPVWLAREIEDWTMFSGVTGPLFPRLRRVGYDDIRPELNKAIGGDHVRTIVKQAAARAGVPEKLATPHGLRRSFVTIARSRGVELADLQAALMHSHAATTERYDKALRAMRTAPGDVLADLVEAADPKGTKR
jgi:integrase/recombinase XerD